MIVGIEGVSCVGKTSLAVVLTERLAPATAVPCYYHAVADPRTLPPIVASSPQGQLAGLRRLLEVERARRAEAVAATAAGRLVVLDRTADTLLAHTAAVSALHGFGIDDQARRLVAERVDQLAVAVPDITLVLTAPFEVRRARAAQRRAMPELLYAENFTAHFLSHFQGPSRATIALSYITLDAARSLGYLATTAETVIRDRARNLGNGPGRGAERRSSCQRRPA